MLDYEKAKEKAAFKEMNFKQKKEHIKEYYRLHIILGIVGIFLIGWALNHYIINPPKKASVNITFHSYLVDMDSFDPVEAELKEAFPELYTDRTHIEFIADSVGLDNDADMEYASIMKIMAMIEAKSVDILVGGYDIMSSDAYQSYLMPLDEIFTEEELQKIEQYGYKQEGADSSIIYVAPGDINESGYEYQLEPRMFLVDISGNLGLRTIICGEPTYIGFCVNSPRIEQAKEVFWYLLTGERQ